MNVKSEPIEGPKKIRTDLNQELIVSTTPSVRRRVLLKGSAAALPALLTLRSGAAIAVTSASICTVDNESLAQTENPPAISVTEDPIWVRQEAQCLMVTNDKGTTKLQIYTTGDPGVFDTLWYTGDNLNVFFNYNATENTIDYEGGSFDTLGSPSTCYVIVRVNADGTKVIDSFDGLGRRETEFNMITHSCWVSLMPAA